MEQLKTLLGDLYDQVIAKIGTTKLIVDDGTWIPKHRFDELNDAKKTAEKAAAKAAADLETVKAAASGNSDLQKQISDLQAANKLAADKYAAEQLQTKKEAAVLIGLMDAGVGNPDARALLAKGIDLSKIELTADGKPKDFDAIVKPIKENVAFKGLFGTVKIVGQDHQAGDTPPPLSKLEAQLAEAQKTHQPLSVIIALKRQIADEESAKPKS